MCETDINEPTLSLTVAVDSFKGSMTSLEAGEAIRKGILAAYPEEAVKVWVRPLADGGEGTVDALVFGMDGKKEKVTVTNPKGRKITAQYGILSDGKTAVLEMAAAAGLTLVDPKERNPLYTTTFGVGEMIADAVKKGCRRFIVGIGGSATNDGGAGMLQALGFKLKKGDGQPIAPGAIGLRDLAAIDDSDVSPELAECTFRVACDVTNPLCGELGASAVFAPQKGATPQDIEQMDKWLNNYARIAAKNFPKTDPTVKGAGAAGGLGFAFLTFTDAKLESGVDIVLTETKLEQYIKNSDIVITGEGRIDGQTVMGKAPGGVAKIAKKYNKPVLAFVGSVGDGAKNCNRMGIDAYFPILRAPMTLSEATDPNTAAQNITDTAEQAMRMARIFYKNHK